MKQAEHSQAPSMEPVEAVDVAGVDPSPEEEGDPVQQVQQEPEVLDPPPQDGEDLPVADESPDDPSVEDVQPDR